MSTVITLDPNNDKAQSLNQLGTYNYTVKAAGMHTVSFAAQVIPVSGLTITIQQNGTTVATSSAPAYPVTQISSSNAGAGPVTTAVKPYIGQQQTSLRSIINCAIGDVLSVILASASGETIQGILNIRQGTV